MQSSFNLNKILVSFAALIIIISGIKAASSIVVPFLLSIFIATSSAPLMFWLEKLKIPRVLAFLIVLFMVIATLFLFGYIVTTSIDNFLANAPMFNEKIVEVLDSFRGFLSRFGMTISKEDIEGMLHPMDILKHAEGFLKSFSTILSKSFIIFLGVTFMLLETSSLKTKMYLLTKHNPSDTNPFKQFSKKLNRYIAIKTVVSFITAILITIGLYIIGVEFALLLGVIAFLLNYIPSIGSVIAAIPAILVALVGLDMSSVIWVMSLYFSVNMIIGNIIEPRYMGKGLGLSVVVIFFSLIFWGWVLGSVGMFLAIPLTMTLKIAFESYPSTKSISMLLSSVDKGDKLF